MSDNDQDSKKKMKWEDPVNRAATLVKSIGVLLGVVGFFLALFPSLRLWILGTFTPRYEVYLGYVYGPDLSRLTRDQFYSGTWAHGLKNLDNLFFVEGEVIQNVGGETIPGRDLKTGKLEVQVAPGACVLVHDLRFSASRLGTPTNPPINITSGELRARGGSPAKALISMLPAGFEPAGCDSGSTDSAKACGHVDVLARANVVKCSPDAKAN